MRKIVVDESELTNMKQSASKRLRPVARTTNRTEPSVTFYVNGKYNQMIARFNTAATDCMEEFNRSKILFNSDLLIFSKSDSPIDNKVYKQRGKSCISCSKLQRLGLAGKKFLLQSCDSGYAISLNKPIH